MTGKSSGGPVAWVWWTFLGDMIPCRSRSEMAEWLDLLEFESVDRDA